MRSIRIISRLDIKGPNLIKGIQLEGLRVLGDPQSFSSRYYEEGIDEFIFMDVVASLYGRNNLSAIMSHAATNIFVPITVGGGVRSLEDASNLLRSGADKIAINTAAVANPKLLTEIATKFGAQCVVLSIEAKRTGDDKWEVFTENGREKTGLNVEEWVRKGIDLGAGEVFVTSVDNEGTRKGFDVELYKKLSPLATVPLIASGGFGNPTHIKTLLAESAVDAIAIADGFHYKRHSVAEIKTVVRELGYKVR